MKGSHVGSYLPSSGVWHHTQRYLNRKNNDPAIVEHLDFDAPTREAGQLHLDDRVCYSFCLSVQLCCNVSDNINIRHGQVYITP